MNLAAAATHRRFLWFLHADSRLGTSAISSLVRSLREAPDALHYFDLVFETDQLRRMAINNVGVWVRSHLLGMPFGDQGFCVKREVFARLGGFDEQARYGEDHLLVWSAHRAGIKVRCTGEKIGTSARKYLDRGWLATTVDHQALTIKQAWPQVRKLLKGAG